MLDLTTQIDLLTSSLSGSEIASTPLSGKSLLLLLLLLLITTTTAASAAATATIIATPATTATTIKTTTPAAQYFLLLLQLSMPQNKSAQTEAFCFEVPGSYHGQGIDCPDSC